MFSASSSAVGPMPDRAGVQPVAFEFYSFNQCMADNS